MFRFSDGFDSYGTTANELLRGWTELGGFLVNPRGGITGRGAMYGSNANIIKEYRKGSNADTLTNTAFWFKASAPPTGDPAYVVTIFQVGWLDRGIYFHTAGGIGVNNSTGLLCPVFNAAGASAANICDGQWHWIEVTIFRPVDYNADGSMTVYCDGVEVLSDINTGTVFNIWTGTARVAFYAPSTIAAVTYDDVIIWDDEGTGMTTFPLGVRRIETIRPSGAGTFAQWTPLGAAANYDAVDEALSDGDATRVVANTAGKEDLYNFNDVGTPISAISGVIVTTVVGGNRTVRVKAKSSTSTAIGTGRIGSPTAYLIKQDAFMTDPSTSSAWTESGLNAAEFGFELEK